MPPSPSWRRIRYSPSTRRLFFPAEDGIRDVAVTGVQTCALPIYVMVRHREWLVEHLELVDRCRHGRVLADCAEVAGQGELEVAVPAALADARAARAHRHEIGRASCRDGGAHLARGERAAPRPHVD